MTSTMISALAAGIVVTAYASLSFNGSCPSNRTSPIHHGARPERALEFDAVALFVETARQACFQRGNSPDDLRGLAANEHWIAVPGAELEKNGTPYSVITSGWTFQSGHGAFAIMQSALRAPLSGYVCSATTTITSDTQHRAVKELLPYRDTVS